MVFYYVWENQCYVRHWANLPVNLLKELLKYFSSCSSQVYILYVNGDITSMHFFLFRSIVALNLALPSWKMLPFVSLPAILGTSHCLVFFPPINTVLLLGAPILPTRWASISTYLQSEQSLSITFAHQPKLLIIDFFTVLIFCIIQFLFLHVFICWFVCVCNYLYLCYVASVSVNVWVLTFLDA
jgi:hypothetical protein